MEMLPEADSVVRQLMPSVFDAAGMAAHAERLRSIGVLSAGDAMAALEVLAEATDSSSADPVWAEPVAEATFWGTAALWAAHDGDQGTFDYAVRMVMSVLRGGLPGRTLH